MAMRMEPAAAARSFVQLPKEVGWKLLHTPEEAANRLGIGRTTIYELLASKQLESVVIGRSRRIPAAALVAYVEGLRAGA